MSLPDLPRANALSLRPKAELERGKRNARLAALTATLGLFGWRADTAPTSLALIVARTADLCDEDFVAALDHLADKWEAIGNPIPAIRKAAAVGANLRVQALDDARVHPADAVPMPEELRRKIRGLRGVPELSHDEERAKKATAFRKLAAVLSDPTNPTDARARDGADG